MNITHCNVPSKALSRDVGFWLDDQGVFTDVATPPDADKPSGSMRIRICAGGRFRGIPVICDEHEMPAVARKWLQQYIRACASLARG